MDQAIFRTLLFAVGSLPFWTGERKLKQFLRGDAGSFWEEPPPLKPTYLRHHFYGALEQADNGSITRAFQRLKKTGYLTRERLSSSLPHQVIKLTSKGVFQYYNLLVTEKEHEEPTWWIHHLSRLKRRPKQPIITGGEVITFSGHHYVSQTPGFVETETRVRDEGSIRLVGESELSDSLQPGQTIFIREFLPKIDQGVELVVSKETQLQSLPPSDLRRKLTHFSPREPMPGEEDPYVIRGRLSSAETDVAGSIKLTLKQDSNTIQIVLPGEQKPEQIDLQEGDEYIVGPVKRDPENSDHLQLQPTGEINKYNPFS